MTIIKKPTGLTATAHVKQQHVKPFSPYHAAISLLAALRRMPGSAPMLHASTGAPLEPEVTRSVRPTGAESSETIHVNGSYQPLNLVRMASD